MRRIKKLHGQTGFPQSSMEELGLASSTPSLFPLSLGRPDQNVEYCIEGGGETNI